MAKTQQQLFAERDAVLDRLQETRAELIAVAKETALRLAAEHGETCSVDVLNKMRLDPVLKDKLDEVDPRFMGAVFRAGNGWQRVRMEPKGSHACWISIWRRKQ